MVGFYTGELGSVALEEQGTDATSPAFGDVLAASADSAFAAGPTPRLLRAPLGGGLDQETQDYWRNYRDPAGRNQGSDVDAMAAERGERPGMLSPEEANERYGIKGVLSFDKPTPEPVAADLQASKHAEIVRQDTIERRTPGVMTGMFARGVTGLAMGLLDPVNLAAGLMPGFGEARIAGAMGLDLAASMGARIGTRALAGASGGALGMAALEPLNYVLDQREHNDWTMGEALRDIAFGGLLGGGLHVGLGGLFGRVSVSPLERRLAAAGPEADAMALRGAVAHVAEGRPVEVAPALDLVSRETGEPPIPGNPPVIRNPSESAPRDLVDLPHGQDGLIGLIRQMTAHGEAVDAAAIAYRSGNSEDYIRNVIMPEAARRTERDATTIEGTVVQPVSDITRDPGFVGEAAGPPPATQTRRATPFEPEKQPLRLNSFLMRPTTIGRAGDINTTTIPGGLRDPGGDLRAIIGGAKGRPGFINNATGRTLDDAAQHAWEQGYFPGHAERPSINELLDAIREDHAGNPRYSIHDQEAADAYHHAIGNNAEVLRLSGETGIPTENRTREQFFDAVAQHSSVEEMALRQTDLDAAIEAEWAEAEKQAKAWTAYHGTPHTFDQFDVGKIGTGEGAQAYGHGLYFAESEGVAEGYKRRVSEGEFISKVKESYGEHDNPQDAEAELMANPDLSAAEKRLLSALKEDDWLGFDYPHQAVRAALHEPDNFDLSPESKSALRSFGNLLTVRIKAKPEEMLNWDKPLSEQPKAKAVFEDRLGMDADAHATAGDALKAAEREVGDPAEISRVLSDAGIKGIRYLDAGSRREGEGTHNVVIFDHADVEITHRNGEPVAAKGFDAEQFYGHDQARSLEDLEREYGQANAAATEGQRGGGDAQPGPAAGPAQDVQGTVRQDGYPAGPARRDGEAADATGTAGQSLRELRDNAARSAEHPADTLATKANAEAVERAPKVEGPLDKQLAELQKATDDTLIRVQAEIDGGRLTEADLAPLREADAMTVEAERQAKAHEAAAACLASRIA